MSQCNIIYVSIKHFYEIPEVTKEEAAAGPDVPIFRYPCDDGGFFVKGLGEDGTEKRLCILSKDREMRIQQMCESGKLCDICAEYPPQNELPCTIKGEKGPENVVAYLCNGCDRKVAKHNMKLDKRAHEAKKRMAKGYGEKNTKAAGAIKKAKAKRKSSKAARKAGRTR